MPKRSRLRRGLRIPAKALEEALVVRARKLRDDPDIFFPTCQSHDDHFYKWKVRFKRIVRYKDSEKRLIALSRRGDQLSKSFATSLQIALKGEVPRLASINVGGRDVPYVYNRKVKKEILVGMQYYDDPNLRLLAFEKIARSKRIHLYSMKESFVCTGVEDRPPMGYVREVISTTRYSFRRAGGSYVCAHSGEEGIPYLRLGWLAPGLDVVICKSCAGEENTYATLTSRLLSPRPRENFRVEVCPNFKLECEGGDILNSCVFPSDELLARYFDGSIDDTQLIEGHIENIRSNPPSGEERVLVIGARCFGDDVDLFLDALSPTEVERRALKALLEEIDESVIVETATPNKILMRYWDNHGLRILKSMAGDDDIAESVFEEGQRSNLTPVEILKEVVFRAKKERVESSLPKFANLPPVAAFADRIARVYKTRGTQAAIMEANKESSQETRIKSMKYAFLLALDSASGKEWQFTKEQQDFGNFLMSYVRKLLDCEASEYHESLQNLLKASGSTQEI